MTEQTTVGVEAACPRCGHSSNSVRYCERCGYDRGPDAGFGDENQRALAAERERRWAAEHPDATKACPDCAERVAGAARICRFCGYPFDTQTSGRGNGQTVAAEGAGIAEAPERPRKSPGGAAVMGFLLAGLGHVYTGEYARAAIIFFSAAAAGIGAAIGSPGVGLWALVILAFSARDAYVSARYVNEHKVNRPLAGYLWVIAAVGAILLGVGIYQANPSASSNSPDGNDPAQIGDEILPSLQHQLRVNTGEANLLVISVDCVQETRTMGSCVAEFGHDDGSIDHLSIRYSTGGGDLIWHTE